MFVPNMRRNATASSILALAAAVPALADGFGPGFTYQGKVTFGGEPVSGNIDVRFRLLDEFNAPVGSPSFDFNVDPVFDTFTSPVNAAGEFGPSAFDGSLRKLQISVRSAGDPNSAWAVLSPTQNITPAPYALYAASGPGGGGSLWQPNGADIYYNQGAVGIGTPTPGYPLDVAGTARASSFSVANPNNAAASVTLSWFDDVPRIRYGGSSTGSQNGFVIQGQNDATKLRLLNDGSLGLRTIPQADFHIVDSGACSILLEADTNNNDNSTPRIDLRQNGASTGAIVGIRTGSGDLELVNQVAGNVVLATNGADRLVVRGTTGNVEISENVYLTNPGIASIESVSNTGIQIDNGTNKVHLLSDNSRVLTADISGNVGIGTETPGTRLEIMGDVRISNSGGQPTLEIEAEGGTGTGGSELHMYSLSGSETITLDAEFAAGSLLRMKDRSGDDVIIMDAQSAGADVRFYNQHGRQTVVIDADDGADDGAVLQLFADTGTATTATLELHSDFDGAGTSRVITDVLQINGADLSEQFDVSSACAIEPGMVVSIDPDNAGKLAIATEAYDRKVAGIISGAGGVRTGLVMSQEGTLASGEYAVALTGRVWCKADARFGAIEPGDQLTTSSTPGHAMNASDHARSRGAVIGKAMTRLASGTGMVLVLVQPQ